MKRYVIVLKLPEIIQEGCKRLIDNLARDLSLPEIKNYPPHIALKYGFEYDNEEKLKRTIVKFNRSISKINITINGIRKFGPIFHVNVQKNSYLKDLQKSLHDCLQKNLLIQDFRDKELSDDYQFKLTLANSQPIVNSISEIKKYLEKKNLNISFTTSSLGIMVKEDDSFVNLNLEEPEMNFYDYLINPKEPFIIAEIGSNHNGNLEKAKQLIDIAKNAGCNAVKFQSFNYDSLFSKEIFDAHSNMVAKDIDVTGLEAIQKKLSLSKEDHYLLKKYADEKEITFLSTPLDLMHIDWLEELDVQAYKIASLDIVHLELIKKVAQKEKPILLSTGMATMGEIENAIHTIKNEGNDQIVLLHCVAEYPTPSNKCNLRNIKMLADTFNLPVGFSDHSKSTAIPSAAVAYGASVIEKHIKIEGLHCRDEAVSLNSLELKTMVNNIHEVAQSFGSFKRILTQGEVIRKTSVFGRRSILTNCSLKAGDIVTLDEVSIKRPGTGLSPDKLKFIIGRALKVDKRKEESLLIEDFI
jgi:N,N'-diacetyllegionaminate synthase